MKFKRFLVLICICSLCICMTANVKAKADAFPLASEILTLLPGVELTGIANAYQSLTAEQKLIAHYIIGAFNNIYLCARGFSYSIDQDETAFKAQFLAMGELVFQYVTKQYGWKSRFNEVFRQYLSSAIVYASGISTTFEAWYQGVRQGGANQLYIPYSQDAFDAWTEWYNDPSGDGIASLGETVSEWESGTFYDYAWRGIGFESSSAQNTYNNFILNNSPVLYSNYTQPESNGNPGDQRVLGFGNHKIIDSLFVLRNSTQYCRYGYSEPLSYPDSNASLPLLKLYYYRQISAVYVYTDTVNYRGIINHVSNSVEDLINYAFSLSPFGYSIFNGSYYLVEHVYLVDDLNTLANPEEVFNVENLNIIPPSEAQAHYIVSPNGLFLSPTWPTADGDPMGFWDIIQDNSYNVDTQLPASDDDFKQTIVNNTTINNYYVTDSDKINVPVEWFENDLTDQLALDSIPFLQFARDCIDCLGDLQIYLYGAVVFGLAGGVLKKFLL